VTHTAHWYAPGRNSVGGCEYETTHIYSSTYHAHTVHVARSVQWCIACVCVCDIDVSTAPNHQPKPLIEATAHAVANKGVSGVVFVRKHLPEWMFMYVCVCVFECMYSSDSE
jgi:hypothetical protein